MSIQSEKISIYTDGSCLNNPGRGGYGAIIQRLGVEGTYVDEVLEEVVLSGGEPNTTNNRMEMMAILEAVKWCNKNVGSEPVSLYSDSSYVLNSITKGWKRKANIDIWAEMDKALAEIAKREIQIKWNWVKGHAGNELNERVDEIAVKESRNQPFVDVESSFETIGSAEGNVNTDSGSSAAKATGAYNCKKCGKNVDGVLSFMPDSGMIRVDCDNCESYIMFAEKTAANLKQARKRVLISKRQLAEVARIKGNRGEAVTENQLKKIKRWTKQEAENFIMSEQTLF
jgi:ribonuclease HI